MKSIWNRLAVRVLAVLIPAAVLWTLGIMWGLPNMFNADEPHIVNLAVSFGSGSLRPYAFKYPTLWPYLLFFCYGVYFLVWSGFGRHKSVGDFAGLYAWHPTGFYLIGRMLSAAAGLAGLLVVWKTEETLRDRVRWPWAFLLLAVSPVFIDLSHSLKPNCLMFLFVSAAWYWALRLYKEGTRRSHWLCGLFLGLAMTTEYTALPAVLALLLAHLFSRGPVSRRWLLEAFLCADGAFIAGSPYAVLDYHNFVFWLSMNSPRAVSAMGPWSRSRVFGAVLANLVHFSGAGPFVGLAEMAGLFLLWRKDRRLAAILVCPLLCYVLILISKPEGGTAHYLLGGFPALALLASEGLGAFEERGGASAAILAAILALGPGAAQSARMDIEMRLPDTRQEAQAWIEANIPQGSVLLIDEGNVSPALTMSRDEAVLYWKKDEAMGSPRSRLYRAMAETHPGGGYWIYRIKRSARDLATYQPDQVALSQAEQPFLNVDAGLAAARQARVEYVMTSSYGATPGHSPELAAFFGDLGREGRLLKTFQPMAGKKTGPVLEIFRL